MPTLPDTVALLTLPGSLRMGIVAGDGQTGAAGELLAAPIVVQVLDAAGRPMAGALVRVARADSSQGALEHSGGAEVANLVTDTDGRVEVRWRMPAPATTAPAAASTSAEARRPTIVSEGIASALRGPCRDEQLQELASAGADEVHLAITVPGAPCLLLAAARVGADESVAAPEVLSISSRRSAVKMQFSQRMH
jgi:hypothetical protein